MKIAVDVAALCAPENKRFGNYIFSKNLLNALSKYDKANEYYLYSFCDSDEFAGVANFHLVKLAPSAGFMKIRLPLAQFFSKCDVFLALNQAIPSFTNAKIIAFSHGLSFRYFPDLYKNNRKRLEGQLEDMLKRGDHIIVSSLRVKREMKEIAPHFHKISVMPYGVPFDILNKPRLKKKSNENKYFLYVGMDHQVKRIDLITDSFSKAVKKAKAKGVKLILAGIGGDSIKRDELTDLYRGASALITASYYESFNLPVLEALASGTAVIGLKSAIIPEFKKYVTRIENQQDLVDAIVDVMKKKPKRVGFNPEEFSWKNYVEQLKNIYKKL